MVAGERVRIIDRICGFTTEVEWEDGGWKSRDSWSWPSGMSLEFLCSQRSDTPCVV